MIPRRIEPGQSVSIMYPEWVSITAPDHVMVHITYDGVVICSKLLRVGFTYRFLAS